MCNCSHRYRNYKKVCVQCDNKQFMSMVSSFTRKSLRQKGWNHFLDTEEIILECIHEALLLRKKYDETKTETPMIAYVLGSLRYKMLDMARGDGIGRGAHLVRPTRTDIKRLKENGRFVTKYTHIHLDNFDIVGETQTEERILTKIMCENALKLLSPQEREMLRLKLDDGLTLAQIGRIKNLCSPHKEVVSEGRVSQLMERIKDRLETSVSNQRKRVRQVFAS